MVKSACTIQSMLRLDWVLNLQMSRSNPRHCLSLSFTQDTSNSKSRHELFYQVDALLCTSVLTVVLCSLISQFYSRSPTTKLDRFSCFNFVCWFLTRSGQLGGFLRRWFQTQQVVTTPWGDLGPVSMTWGQGGRHHLRFKIDWFVSMYRNPRA